MAKTKRIPVALTVAGSDSGGGAGIQADLKTFVSLGVHGTSAVTCLTAQNPVRVVSIEACTPGMLRRQLQAVFDELPPAAAKTGMLYSSALIRVVADFFGRERTVLVVDPVMVATSGARLLEPSAIRLLKEELFPRATVLTPNVQEAEVLVGGRIRSVSDLRKAALEIHQQFGCAALVKGGHLRGLKEAVDVFHDAAGESLLRAPFITGVATHGTGCTLSSAITAYLALGEPLRSAVVLAKNYITQAVANSWRVSRHSVLDWFSRRR
jgi:hydroxymethylpyrimidine/phosphomethylpyrimidine kinase